MPCATISVRSSGGTWKRRWDDLRADPVAWQEYQDEIRLLEGGSMDGLEAEEPYYTAAEVEEILDKQD